MSAQDELAHRIAYERERRGWSYEDTAIALAREGLELHYTAIYKTEKKGRRVTVDELVALASAFDTTPGDLLRPVAEVADEEVGVVTQRFWASMHEINRATAEMHKAVIRLNELASMHDIAGVNRVVRGFLEALDQLEPFEEIKPALDKLDEVITGGEHQAQT